MPQKFSGEMMKTQFKVEFQTGDSNRKVLRTMRVELQLGMVRLLGVWDCAQFS